MSIRLAVKPQERGAGAVVLVAIRFEPVGDEETGGVVPRPVLEGVQEGLEFCARWSLGGWEVVGHAWNSNGDLRHLRVGGSYQPEASARDCPSRTLRVGNAVVS